jgi:hypothetical protein
MDRPFASLRTLSALVAALLCTPAIAVESGNSLPEAWQAVPDGELATMRGGIDFGTLVASFAVERLVRINGEVVARTHLALSGFGDLANGLAPSVEVLGNLANLIQVSQGGGGSGGGSGGEPLTASDMAHFAQAIGQGAQGGSSSTSMAASSSNGRTGTGGADAVAGSSVGGLSSAQLPGGSASSIPPASVPAAVAAAQGAGGRPVSSGGLAPRPPGPSQAGHFGDHQHAATLARPGSTPVGGAPMASAAPGASPSSQVATGSIMNPPISVPIGNTGQAIVVSGIPNAAALATSIQNSVESTRIETLTSINATLSSLAALRSANFAETMRQQAIDSIRR